MVVVLSSCHNVRYLQEGDILYNGTEVSFRDSVEIPEDLSNLDTRLERLSKLKPNKRILGIYPLRMWLYNLGATGFDQYIQYGESQRGEVSLAPFIAGLAPLQPDSDLRGWLMEKVGEPPSLVDSTLLYETQIRMENYLYNRGYFYPTSEFSLVLNEKRRRAEVQYLIDPGPLYIMNNVVYEIEDPELKRIALLDSSRSLVVEGRRLDVDFLKEERNRISNSLTNNGYYQFNKEYVYFEVDSTSGSDSLDLFIKVAEPENDSIHRRFLIRNIYIVPDVRDQKAGMDMDTVVFDEYTRSGKTVRSTYNIVEAEQDYTPKSLADNVFINSGDYYSRENSSLTVGAFSNLGMFKYTTIKALPFDTAAFFRYMDVEVRLEPLKKRDLTLQFDASTTSEYLFANYASASYSVRNEFKRLDLLSFSLNGGVEFQIDRNVIALNTSEFTAQTRLQFPRFFWPFSLYTPKNYYPRTITTLKLEYLDRVQFYTLFNTALKYGSERFEGTRTQQLSIYPIDINYVLVPRTTAAFDSILNGNFLLQQSFQEQLILAPNLTYIYNSQALETRRNNIYFRGKMEFAGSLFYLANALPSGSPLFGPGSTPEDPFTLINLPFSNYTRIDLDLRDYLYLFGDNSLAGRIAVGIASPYWNSEVVPFVKQFYVGGANSIRAFPIRKVGPGDYLSYVVDDNNQATPVFEDQTGEVKIELNLEYRFDLIGALKGAVFCDAGNVWTLREDEFRPGSEFRWDSFYKQFAVGPGAGLRLDFSYFIIRLDGAYPLIDPAVDGEQGRALAAEGVVFPTRVINWNLAIGYPF